MPLLFGLRCQEVNKDFPLWVISHAGTGAVPPARNDEGRSCIIWRQAGSVFIHIARGRVISHLLMANPGALWDAARLPRRQRDPAGEGGPHAFAPGAIPESQGAVVLIQ